MKGVFTAKELMAMRFPPDEARCEHFYPWMNERCNLKAKDGLYCGVHSRMRDISALRYVFQISHQEAMSRIAKHKPNA